MRPVETITNREALRRLLMGANERAWAPERPEKQARLPRSREAARRAAERAAAAVEGWRR